MNAALAIAPTNVPLHSDLGWFYFRTGRYDDALRQCRIALEMSARDASAQTCEERSLSEMGQSAQAWQALRGHAPEWLDAESVRAFDALDPAQAYRAAMHLAAQKARERNGAGLDTARWALAGERAQSTPTWPRRWHWAIQGCIWRIMARNSWICSAIPGAASGRGDTGGWPRWPRVTDGWSRGGGIAYD